MSKECNGLDAIVKYLVEFKKNKISLDFLNTFWSSKKVLKLNKNKKTDFSSFILIYSECKFGGKKNKSASWFFELFLLNIYQRYPLNRPKRESIDSVSKNKWGEIWMGRSNCDR